MGHTMDVDVISFGHFPLSTVGGIGTGLRNSSDARDLGHSHSTQSLACGANSVFDYSNRVQVRLASYRYIGGLAKVRIVGCSST
jgi:hypothetical protein